MRLSALSGEPCVHDPEITGLTADSRAVEKGFLFAALPGVAADGVRFIPQAEERGAVAVLAKPGVSTRLPFIADETPRRRLARMAATFYNKQPDVIVGVTGTNGKTSTARFTAELWRLCGREAGSLGTLGAVSEKFERKLAHTTPEPVTLHQVLDEMATAGVSHLAMEVSSHALAQHRADGVLFAIAAFTNITQDHLDYHKSFEDYFDAKARLFTELLRDDGAVVINADGEGARTIAAASRQRSLKVLTTGVEGEDIRLINATPTATGLDVDVDASGKRFKLRLPLIGAFQAENALLAAGIVIASGEPAGRVLPLLEKLNGVPGRMQKASELVLASGPAAVYVDYAHTPDAIATALKAARPHADGRVIVIIGAGGDRDREKRSLMGKAAQENADIVIVTDDNPRSEEPALIRYDVMQGCPGAKEIGDRRSAIEEGVAMLKAGDILLVAGKGHETGQQVGEELLPFNDAQVAEEAARARTKDLGR